ncbi:S8 family serine peptidase [Echinicola sp. 20G]|uniref:S8 family serine peptidase n=1 Tax=Echinicola sp. 20G TaxID=2781961 RepID=UPI00190FCB53|nr:S8 family serine peptidase [Echinicola sp. 20G]
MDNIKRLVIVTALIILQGTMAYGQDRYAIKYKYKPQDTYSLDEPTGFLTQKAMDRREREGVLADSTDLPVAERYIDIIDDMVDNVQYHSKWINASVVVANAEQIEAIKALPFVKEDGVELVAKGFYMNGRSSNSNILKMPVSIQVRGKSKAEEDYAFQNGLLGVPEMHGEGLTGKGITIAVFDGGFMNTDEIVGLKHLFDDNKIIATKDLVTPWSESVYRTETHGTSALSLIAANDVNTLVSGAYGANYILCITEDVASEYRIEEYNWARAAEFADSLGVDIINSSLGYTTFNDPSMNYEKSDLDGKTAVITQAATLAAERGILVVSSAGNEGGGSETTITAPSDAEGILAIGAVSKDLSRASFSSIGPTADGRIKPDLSALGSGVRLWRGSNNTSTASGTSFSAPQIAALAAGIWQGRPHWTKDELIHYLLKSGSQAENPDDQLGYGIPNFDLVYFGEVLDVEEEFEEFQTKIYPNPVNGEELFIQFGNSDQCDFTLIDTNGKVIGQNTLTRNSNRVPYEVQLAAMHTGLYVIELNEGFNKERHKLLIK